MELAEEISMPKWAFTLINGIFLALCKCGENFGVFFYRKMESILYIRCEKCYLIHVKYTLHLKG